MVNLEIFPELEWVGHDFDDAHVTEAGNRFFELAVVGHSFYPEGNRLWSYGPGLPFFCLAGGASGGLHDRMEAVLFTKFEYTRVIGGWKK